MMRSMWIAGLLSLAGCGVFRVHYTELCETEMSTHDLTKSPELLDDARLAPWRGVREVPVVWMDGTEDTVTLKLTQKIQEAERILTSSIEERGVHYCGWEEWRIPLEIELTFASGSTLRWDETMLLKPRNETSIGLSADVGSEDFPERRDWWVEEGGISQESLDGGHVGLSIRMDWRTDGRVTGFVRLVDHLGEPDDLDEDTDVVEALGLEWELLKIGGVD